MEAQILAAETITKLEDIYLPYRPKRRTRATIAREKGLEPLATLLFAQAGDTDPLAVADFRRCMQRRYGTVAALNRAWGTDHASFDDVQPMLPAKEGLR